GFAPVWVQNSITGSFGGHRWYIFTSQDPQETHAPIQTLLAWVAGSGLLGISLLAFFSFYATGKLVKPIEELQKGAKLIALGNLQHRLAIRTGDEIEELAMEFNEMADKIKESYTQLEKKVAQRTHDLAVRNKELSSLYTIASLLNKSLNLKGLLDEALSATMMIFETEGGMIHLLDASGTSLRLFSGAGFPAEGLEEKSHNEVLYRRVAQTGIPISFSDDSPEEPPFKNIPFPYFITIPIRAKGKVLGTLSLLDKSSHPFIKQDLELLIAIGNQIGVAIENARLYEETKKVDQLKSDFVSKVSHEFRTPLTSIKGFVELLLSTDDLADQKRKEFLKIVDQESDRLIRLINDVLDISKIEAGKVEWKIEPLRLEEIIRSTVLSTQTLVESKKLQLVVDIASPLPEVRGDRDQLIEVLNNLLSNAIKFTEKGKIVLSIKRLKEKEILVGVKDTGIGVPPGEL
ncbi:MAG TPA: histidine kinase dimerization/phospho-acceptor domain-containing protein, partial [Candidatus Manganitrophaceae bacterium]